jgi:hypothetical protein
VTAGSNMKNNTNPLFFICIFIFAILMTMVVYDMKDECEAKGGVLITSTGYYTCVKLEKIE